nr:MAG TPA: Beta defensin 50 [Caudoviricetes sp.]
MKYCCMFPCRLDYIFTPPLRFHRALHIHHTCDVLSQRR